MLILKRIDNFEFNFLEKYLLNLHSSLGDSFITATKLIYNYILTISSLFGSFLEIYKENGILGYYAGLIPRVIGSAAVIVLTGISTYAINNYVIQEPAMKPYTASTMKVSAKSIFFREHALIHIDTTCLRTKRIKHFIRKV